MPTNTKNSSADAAFESLAAIIDVAVAKARIKHGSAIGRWLAKVIGPPVNEEIFVVGARPWLAAVGNPQKTGRAERTQRINLIHDALCCSEHQKCPNRLRLKKFLLARNCCQLMD